MSSKTESGSVAAGSKTGAGPQVLIIGGGAAGMMAAIAAAEGGARVTLAERNETLGRKLFITGKGRCNLTNDCPPEEFTGYVISNPRFLYSSLAAFGNRDTIRAFGDMGLRTKVERGRRVFPVSDHSSDVIAALRRRMEQLGVAVRMGTMVRSLILDDEAGRCRGAILSGSGPFCADAVIVCTGGLSYPSTGSDGSGYRLAEQAGHTVTPCIPSLVPLTVEEEDIPLLQGLSLKNVRLTVYDGKKRLYDEFGEMLFTHFGISGPLVLSASSRIGRKLEEGKKLKAAINLKAALTREQADRRLIRAFEQFPNSYLKNILTDVYPAKLVPVMIARSGIEPERRGHEITRAQREQLLELTCAFPMTITGLRSYNEAVITKGGVRTREVKPDTMESKKVSGLYFAGEILDVDALTGGFNLQIAWSTGHAAGAAAAAQTADG